MWATAEDARRYHELDWALKNVVQRTIPQHGNDRVAPRDLALYLEWMELLRETTFNIRPFVEKSSPYELKNITYREMANDIRSLTAQVLR